MAPPLNPEQQQYLHDLYYVKNFVLGRDRLFKYIEENNPALHISRRQVMNFLNNQPSHQINRRPPKHKSTTAFKVLRPDYIQIDLIEMPAERRFNYIMTSIDLFTKQANAVPLFNKTAGVIKSKISTLLSPYNKISVLQSDNGGEFSSLNDYCTEHNIKYLTSKSYTPTSQGTIERFNGTLKHMIRTYQTAHNTKLWVNILPELIKNYNSTFNVTTKQAPSNFNHTEARENINKKFNKNPNISQVDFNVNDNVRLVQFKKNKLDKSSYSKEVYVITKVIKSKKPFNLTQYKIALNNKELKGVYNSSDLLLIPS